MKMKSLIVAGCIAIGFFAAWFAIGHFVTDDSGSSTKASGKPQVLGETFTSNPNASTTTAAPTAPPTSQAPSPATTTQAAQPAGTQSATVTPVTQTPATSPPATTTVVLTNAACGDGTATASVAS